MHRSDKPISGYAHPRPVQARPTPSRSTGPRDQRDQDGFRPDIEGLRGVAVALVVLFHAGLLSNASIQLTGGFIGVDLFFVISGFLITGLLIRERERTGRISFSRFYARRVRRILPAAAVVLLITLPICNQLVTLVSRSSVMEDGASAALSIANIRFAMTTNYFNPVSYSPFLHFWSLGVEEQFYFVWPAVMFVAAWKLPRVGSAIALSLIVAVSFYLSLVLTDVNPSAAFYLLPTRAWQLGAGGLLAIGAGSTDRLPARLRRAFDRILAFAGWSALAALITAAVVVDSSVTPYPGSAALIPTLAGVLLIMSGTQPAGPGMLLRLSPIRFLGKISYSLYLWHWPILILGGIYLAGPLGTLSPAQADALALLAIPAAWASWRLVEEPFRRGQIPLPRPSRLVAVGVSMMVALAVVGTMLDFGAQSALASLEGPTPTDTPLATLSTTPLASLIPTDTPAPDATPTPVPEMTAALTPEPSPQPPTSYAVTSAIKPGLGKAPTDYEVPYHAGCLGWERTTTPTWTCVYGDTSGTYTAALVGDSHASALFPGVNAVATAHHWQLDAFLKINCPFLDLQMWSDSFKREYSECEEWNNDVVAHLNKYPVDLVFISMSRWILTVNDADGSVRAESDALIREIQKLPKSTRVVIIQDPPLPVTDIPTCLSAHTDDYRDCSYERRVGFGSYMGQREQRAAQATGAGLIDLTNDICPGTGDCPAVIDDMIVFRDGHHLTATFSVTLGPDIDAQLVKILNAWDFPTAAPSSSAS